MGCGSGYIGQRIHKGVESHLDQQEAGENGTLRTTRGVQGKKHNSWRGPKSGNCRGRSKSRGSKSLVFRENLSFLLGLNDTLL
jgi:hypothetical protein